MEQWWTVVRIASKNQEPVVVVRPGKMTRKGINQLIKRTVNEKKIENFLTGAFRHVLASDKPKY